MKIQDIITENQQGVSEGTDDFSRNVEAFRVYQHLDPMEFYRFANTPQGLKTLAQKAGTTPESVKDSLERMDWGQFPDDFYKDPEDEEQGVAEGSGNWYVRVRGKVLKDKQFNAIPFSSKEEASQKALEIHNKKRIPLDMIKLSQSWMDGPEQGVAEGHADQQRKIFKKNGQPVGEIGIDRESSPGVGQYYMKHYASGTDNSGYDSREEALGDLRHIMKQSAYGELREQGVQKGQAQPLTVAQLATISDEALDQAYGYGRSTPGNTFGWQANLKSAAYAKKMIDSGVTDIEAISDAIHKGWNVTAQAFVQNPDQFADTEKLRAAGKLQAKLDQRAKLMRQDYAQLADEEKEKDRVAARALLQALRGDHT